MSPLDKFLNNPNLDTHAESNPMANAPKQAAVSDLKSKPSVFDSIISTLLGKSDEAMTDGEKRQRSGARVNVSSNAASAASDPGEEYMGIPNAGTGEFGLQDIVRLFMKNAGVGK